MIQYRTRESIVNGVSTFTVHMRDTCFGVPYWMYVVKKQSLKECNEWISKALTSNDTDLVCSISICALSKPSN